MEAILYSVDEEGEQFSWTWILSFNTNFFHEDIFAFKGNNISLIFWNESWNFTSSEHGVDRLKEGFRFDIRISHNETNLHSSWSCIVVEVLDILLKLVITVCLSQGNLEWKSLETNEARESGQTLFSRTTNTDKKDVSSR